MFLLLTASVLAAALPIRLAYEVEPGLADCPDPQQLKMAVAERLGRSPFQEDAALTLRVEIRKTPQGVRAILEGQGGGRRELSSPSEDCAALGSALGVAIAAAVAALDFPSTPPPRIPIVPKGPVPVPQADARWIAKVGVNTTLGMSPFLGGGFRMGIGVRGAPVTLDGEAGADLFRIPATAALSITALGIWGGVSPCVRAGLVAACAALQLGARTFTGSGLNVGTAGWASAGARVEAEFPVVDGIFLHMRGELQFAFVQTAVFLSQREIWKQPPLFGGLSAGVGWNL